MTTLVTPSEKYRDSYLIALREYHDEGRKLNEDLAVISPDFGAFVQSVLDLADWAKIDAGRVPSSHFWLIDAGQYVGELNIRPEMNEELAKWGGNIGYEIRPSKRRQGLGKRILELGLLLAPSFGLKRVLLTCDADNVASLKIIEHNGGKFENEIEGELRGKFTHRRRYWIELE